MKTPIYRIHSLALGMLLLAAAGCSNEMDTSGGEALPEGKYPLEFTSQMLDMSLTRSTTGNIWSGGEELAVKVDGTVKIYTAATLDGKLTAKTTNNDPFYWTKTTETKTVLAYYPYIYGTASVLTVQNDQSGSGYESSDVLFAPSTSIAFTDATKSLTFQHVPVKVIVNLKNGDGVTAAEVQGAAVTFVNQRTCASFDNATGFVTPELPGFSTLIPNTLSTPASGCQKSVQALLVPCQMQGSQFIKVTIGNDDFYYTPTGATDANLTSGKVHTYEITVKRNGIDVKTTESGYWTNGGNENIESSKASAKVGDYYYSDRTYSSTLQSGKTCIGIVFFVNADGQSGKIVSLDESDGMYWSHFCYDESYNGPVMGSLTDGKGATDYMLNTYMLSEDFATYYDTFNWIATKRTTSGDNRWYMPAKQELMDLYNVKTSVNYPLGNVGATKLGNIYWSSTEIDCQYVWAVNFMDYSSTGDTESKFGNNYIVRAIAAF